MSDAAPRLAPGVPDPLGAHGDGHGVNFALASRHAEKVELCLFSADGAHEDRRLVLGQRTGGVWHGYVAGLGPGQIYGYRVFGPYEPARGHRFNHHKLLLDPYARDIVGRLRYDGAVFGYRDGDPYSPHGFDDRDSAPFVPKARVTVPPAPGPEHRRPGRRWADAVVYELHVRGYTKLHPGVPEAWRGTFAALAAPAVIDHLVRLGVTAVELMPVHAFVDELPLVRRGLVNYWGYNPLAWFAPHRPYLADGDPDDMRRAVAALHEAGIEVILDVVFNHTAEGDETGPTLGLRGIDNVVYYRLPGDDRARYVNDSGCGNTVNAADPIVAVLIVDCLRHWAETTGVDGFRFDLAATLGRDADGRYANDHSALAALRRDPLLSRLKLIAEPWDVGPGGHVIGSFPPGWSEWNDRFRDTARRFWTGEAGIVPDLATRMAGSRDLFAHHGRSPAASLNFITAHDGFTLADLVSYRVKRNAANGEDNRDGPAENHSVNCGVEGPSDDPDVLQLRRRQMKNLLVTLLLAQGTPMILAGDEFARSQQGNNNAYCQDNPISWVHWPDDSATAGDLVDFIAGLIRLRHASGLFHPDLFDPTDATAPIVWLRPDGEVMAEDDWRFHPARSLAFALTEVAAAHGDSSHDRFLYVVLNAHTEAVSYRLPRHGGVGVWHRRLDTVVESNFAAATVAAGDVVAVDARALVVFEGQSEGGADQLGRLGIEPAYTDIWGARHDVPPATRAALRACLGASSSTPHGAARSDPLGPSQCYWPPALDKPAGLWGVSLQLYGLRSARNWGIGDFGDLKTMMGLAADLGAVAVGINPVHALFWTRPGHASPYAPSSRLFVDWLYIDVAAVPGFAEDVEVQALMSTKDFGARLAAARDSALVDRPAVAACKRPVLERLYAAFRARHGHAETSDPEAADFQRFVATRGRALRTFATFEALSEYLAGVLEPDAVWFRDWPEMYRDPAAPAVAAFQRDHAERIGFFEYLQWLADRQLADCAAAARARGMPIGLYRDLAVGAVHDGAECWADPSLSVAAFEIGAPPDPFALAGQAWGIAPWHPGELAARRGATFAELLAANMRHAGALRLDHVMGLRRLFWIPRGGSATDGGYVRYPMEALMGVLATESHRHRCLVVGEDLGTVPAGFRGRLREANVLSYRVLYFERTPEGEFIPPARYPVNALATVTTHDLPTMTGFWSGHDLVIKARLGLFDSSEGLSSAMRERAVDRARLNDALRQAGLAGADADPEAAPQANVYHFLAASPVRLVMAQLDDVLEIRDQVNLPGTTDAHPNWLRKLPVALEDLARDPRLAAVADALSARHPRS